MSITSKKEIETQLKYFQEKIEALNGQVEKYHNAMPNDLNDFKENTLMFVFRRLDEAYDKIEQYLGG